ncbi:MAG TPA: ABC transporter permease [Isosphaeraceae bacterium]|jgi:oligopeptide transport system permease protein|nr:ABC transporter permease [Isosphaeraceae bacterium]
MSATMTASPSAAAVRRSTPLGDAWRRYRRNRLAVVGGVIALAIILVAILAPVLAPAPYDYAVITETLQPPSARHLLGTDEVGRDLLSRMIYGARTSMTVGILVPLIGTMIGLVLGGLAGWFGGWIDFIVLRMVEAMTAIPSVIVALVLVTIYGAGLDHLILFLGLTGWVGVTRLTRAQFLALRDREFVVAARAIGTPGWRIMVQHLLPNAAGPIIVVFVLGIPGAVFGEAGLSFLGLGVQDPIPSWGKMITESAPYMQQAPLLGLLPVVGIGLTMLSFSFVGDGLRDALDPSALE